VPRDDLAKCLDAKVKAGRIRRDQAEDALKQVTKHERELSRWNSLGEAGRKAERKVAASLRAKARRQQHRQAKHLLALKSALRAAEAHPDGMGAGTRGLLDIVRHSTTANVASRASSLRGVFHGFFEKGIHALRPRFLGLVTRADRMEDFIRATFGETVKDADAGGLAKAWRQTTDLTRELANRAGADIRYRVDWHVPQKFDPKKLKEGGYQAFRNNLGRNFERLARDRMLHPDTSDPLTNAELEVALPAVYRALVSRGLSEIVPGGDPDFIPPVGKLEHARFLQFKTADDWLHFHNTYGRGSVFGAVMGHLDFMAKEIALMQILGPKHNQVMRQLIDKVRLERAVADKKMPSLDHPRVIETIYRKLTGDLDRWDDAQYTMLLRGAEETRGYLASVQLGSAILSAIADLKTFSRTAAWNGLRRVRAFGELVKQYNPADDTHRRWAIRRGLVAENAATIAFAANRFQDRVSEGGFGSWLANATTTLTGLNGHTQAARFAFGMEFMATLTEHADVDFAKLPDALRQTFEAHRLTAADWDVIRSTPRVEPEDGADFLDPLEIMRRTDIDRAKVLDVSTRLLDMINQEKDFAVIVRRPTSEALATMGTERGTLPGQLMRSFGMYKNFVITWTLIHGQRTRALGGLSGARYMADLAIGMTLLGAIGMTLRDLSKGRDPRDMTDPKFWLAAAFQGGGLGIIGDFAFSIGGASVNRYGKDLGTTLAGPAFEFASDVASLTVGNLMQAAAGEETNFGREAVGFGKRYAPGASFWYSRTIIDRLLWDTLQEEVDPEYRSSFRRMEQNFKDDYGQRFWWRPGRATPDRAPDLGAGAGEDE
jgi:hypothetical protein